MKKRTVITLLLTALLAACSGSSTKRDADEGSAASGSLYCNKGFVYNGEKQLAFLGLQECAFFVRGSFYCQRGALHNSKGRSLDYLGLDDCVPAIRGNAYCHKGFLHDGEGHALESAPGVRRSCVRAAPN